MGFNIEILLPVYSDVEDAFTYYELQSDGLGNRFYKDFFSAISKLKGNPFYYTSYNELFRRIPLDIFPYMIIYCIEIDKTVTIHSVIYAGRKPDLIKEKLSKK